MSIPHGLKRTLVIASGNAGKVREFRELLQQLPLELQPQPEGMEVEEPDSPLLKMPGSKRWQSPKRAGRGRWRMIPASA